MANYINSVNLVGRVGKEPEIKIFDSGTVLAKFTIAVKGRSKDAAPSWFSIQCWGDSAIAVGDYVHKGDLIGISDGELRINRWIDKKTGKQRIYPYINTNRIEFIGSKRDSSTTNSNPGNQNNSVAGFNIPANF